jgi:hypothetical protein
MTAIAADTQSPMTTARSQRLLFVVDGGNVGHRRWKWRSMAAVAMVVFIDGGHPQWRRQWDGGKMKQWHLQRLHLWLMVAAAMVVVIVNCAVAVDAAATIPSLASMVAAKRQSMPLPLTAASINMDCYCRR